MDNIQRQVTRKNEPKEAPGGIVSVATDRRIYMHTKRAFDLILGIIALIVLLPLFLIVAIAIKLDSNGPIIFKQTRVGMGGRTFMFYKFRSMCVEAEESRDGILHLNEVSGPIFKIKNDPRITRFGRFLRKYSLDELPQFFNVLKGDMSFVGPRPPLPCEVVKYDKWQLRRLSVIPGITCLWQVSGRSKLSFEDWVRLDLQYIDSRSFWLDIVILLKTLPAVLSGDGAY